MLLKYSKGRTPYIELESGGKLIFSTSTEGPNGFKFLAFSNRVTKTICPSGGKSKKKKKEFSYTEDCSFTTTMNFDKIPREAKMFGFSNITKNILKKLFKNYINGDVFPRSNLSLLEKDLLVMSGSETDLVDEDPTLELDEEE